MTWSLGKPIWHARPTYPAVLHGWTLCLGWCWIRLCFLADLALNRRKHIGECVKTCEVAFVLLFFYIGSWQQPSLFPVHAPFIFNLIYNRIHGHFLDQLFSPGVLFEGFLNCFLHNRKWLFNHGEFSLGHRLKIHSWHYFIEWAVWYHLNFHPHQAVLSLYVAQGSPLQRVDLQVVLWTSMEAFWIATVTLFCPILFLGLFGSRTILWVCNDRH